MTKNNVVVNIDKNYLRDIVRESGLNTIEFSRKIGRYDRYIKNCMYRGRMDENAAKLVCDLFKKDEWRLIIREKAERPERTCECVTLEPFVRTHMSEMEIRMARIEKEISEIKRRIWM